MSDGRQKEAFLETLIRPYLSEPPSWSFKNEKESDTKKEGERVS
jgi:hypothetical protein